MNFLTKIIRLYRLKQQCIHLQKYCKTLNNACNKLIPLYKDTNIIEKLKTCQTQSELGIRRTTQLIEAIDEEDIERIQMLIGSINNIHEALEQIDAQKLTEELYCIPTNNT